MTPTEEKKQILKEWRHYLQGLYSVLCSKVNILVNILVHHINTSALSASHGIYHMLQTVLMMCNIGLKQGNILHGETVHKLNYLS